MGFVELGLLLFFWNASVFVMGLLIGEALGRVWGKTEAIKKAENIVGDNIKSLRVELGLPSAGQKGS